MVIGMQPFTLTAYWTHPKLWRQLGRVWRRPLITRLLIQHSTPPRECPHKLEEVYPAHRRINHPSVEFGTWFSHTWPWSLSGCNFFPAQENIKTMARSFFIHVFFSFFLDRLIHIWLDERDGRGDFWPMTGFKYWLPPIVQKPASRLQAQDLHRFFVCLFWKKGELLCTFASDRSSEGKKMSNIWQKQLQLAKVQQV